MHIQFFGAAGMVTGSNFLLSDDKGYGILVDMGMFQGSPKLEDLNFQPINFDAREVHSVFLTHAHLDHVGRMPIIMKHGFSGKIYMTAATKEIAEIVLMDAAKIMQRDEEKPILYTEDDVFDLLGKAEIVSYGEEVDLGNVKAIFRDAGHILGSASIEMDLVHEGKKLAFSGDLGNSPEELVRPTEYIKNADVAIMESTYGDRNHPTDNPEETIQREINTVEKSGGTLLIPSFSVERTQVLLHKIAHFKENGKVRKETPVFVDSPMGQRVTKVYKSFPNLYNSELFSDIKGGDAFSFPGIHNIGSYKDSVKIKERNGGKVIIAGSGMMSGGRILEHAKHFLPLKDTRLLIVGFQAENTVGRELEEGARSVHIEGENVKVAAKVNAIHSMSAHADQTNLLKWIGEINGVKKVYLVHGEDGPREALKKEIVNSGISEVYTPHLEEYSEI
jgi:metallo-beta-lactamase family protein